MIPFKQFGLSFLIIAAPFIGSYLATALNRSNIDQNSATSKRSRCLSCRRNLRFFDMLPIVSFLLLKGKCSHCNNTINPIYFAAESTFLITSGLSGFLLWNSNFETFLITIILAWTLIGLSIFDIQKKRLPDLVTVPLICIGFLQAYFFDWTDIMDSVIGACLGALLASSVAIVFYWIRKKIGLGWGDVKLITAFGAWLGWHPLPWFILIASTTAILFLILEGRKKKFNINAMPVAFGPFLSLSGWLIWLYLISSQTSNANPFNEDFLLFFCSLKI